MLRNSLPFIMDIETKVLQKSIGTALTTLRTEHGMTQEGLAEESGIDRSYLSSIERGVKVPTIVTLFKLALGLKVEPEKIIQLVRVEYNVANISDEAIAELNAYEKLDDEIAQLLQKKMKLLDIQEKENLILQDHANEIRKYIVSLTDLKK